MTTEPNEEINLWDHAEYISRTLKNKKSTLIILIGAEKWCQKCSLLKNEFNLIFSSLKDNIIPLWLDLEDHSSFIGNYVPYNIPEIFIYRNGNLKHRDFLTQNDILWNIDIKNFNGAKDDKVSKSIYNNIINENWSPT